MKKIVIIIIGSFLSVYLLADWGDEEENGGVYQWRPIKPYSYKPLAVFYEMSVLDSTNAVALIGRGSFRKLEIWYTDDACNSWDILYSELDSRDLQLGQLSFPTENYIFATGSSGDENYILRSMNMGKAWDTITTPHFRFGWNLNMYDSLIGVCVESIKADSSISYANPKHYISKIQYTKNGCKTWKESRPDSIFQESLSIIDFHVFSPEHFGAVSYNAGEYGDGPMYIWTEDGGETWDISYISPRDGMEAFMTPQPRRVYFFSDSVGWIPCTQRENSEDTAEFDVLFKTTDFGRTWELKYKVLDTITCGLMDIKFLNEKEGIAVGSMGKILRTTDGGETWLREYGKDPEHVKCPEGKVTAAHLYTHGHMRIEYFGSKPIIWTRDANYPLWEYDPFTVGVEITKEKENFKLYPNPVSSGSYLHLNYEPAFKSVAEIYSLTGELIYKKQLYGDHIFIPTDISAGTYVLVLNLDGEILAREKFIVE